MGHQPISQFSVNDDNLYSPYNGSKGTIKKQTNERKKEKKLN